MQLAGEKAFLYYKDWFSHLFESGISYLGHRQLEVRISHTAIIIHYSLIYKLSLILGFTIIFNNKLAINA